MKLSEDFAEKHGLDLVETLEDIGVSAFKGKNSKEGALGGFLEAIESGKVSEGSYLLVESLDRVSRESVINAFNLFSRILQKKVVIVTLADNQIYNLKSLEDNPGQIFMTIGIMLRANEESKTKSERLSAVWQQKKKLAGSKKITAMCPAWLNLDKKSNTFVLNKLAETIKQIFELSIQGYGTSAICQLFNSNLKKYPPIDKLKGWHKSYIQKILNNPAVYGEYQPHSYRGKDRAPSGEVISDYYPAVVSKETFDLSKARMAERRVGGARRKGETFTNIFTRMVCCSGCGQTAVFRDKGEYGGRSLRCGQAERSLYCSAPPWDYDEFESSFFSFVGEIDLESIFTNDRTEVLKQEAVDKLALLEANLKTAQQAYGVMFDLEGMVDGVVLQDLASRLTEKQAEITTIKNEIARATNELVQLTQKIGGESLKENLAVYEKLVVEKDKGDLKAIRHKIYNQIRHLIKNIKFYNLDRYEPADDLSELDAEFLALLKKKRYKTEEQQINYLQTEAGQRTFGKYHRSYTIEFKNGIVKYVRPSQGIVMDFNKLGD